MLGSMCVCVCCPIVCVPVALLSCVIGVFLTGSLFKSTSFEQVAAHQHQIMLPSAPHKCRQINELRNNLISVLLLFFSQIISVKSATHSVHYLTMLSFS